uniref:Uncharacterized protein n=1 Tax=viral metagenome TaxID=1070528 RepID=A0A6C0LCX7_9ZZZZ
MDLDYDDLLQASDDDYDLLSDTEEQELQEQEETEESIKEYEKYGISINNSLAQYLETLENKLQEGKLDDYTFMLENLLVKYKQALIHRRFNIDNKNDSEKIERIRVLKSELEQEFINENIDEFEFNRKYYNLLDLELNILLKYEDFSVKSKKIAQQVPKSFDKSIDSLIQSEHQYLKNVAKERNIDWPEKPKVKKGESKKLKLKNFLTYYIELEKAYNLAKKYIPGYKLRTIEETKKADLDVKWTLEYPNSLKLNELYEEYLSEKKQRLNYSDPIDELKFKKILSILKNKSREELLNCVDEANVIHKLSYIERLKLNTIPVMKFKEYPESYEKLQEILGEEAKYYKISANDLMKDFNKKFFNVTPNVELSDLPSTFKPVYFVKTKKSFHKTDVPSFFNQEQELIESEYKIKSSTKGYSFLMKTNEVPLNNKKEQIYKEYVEKGSVVSISLKPEYFKSYKVLSGIIDEKYYDIIKPLPDNLYESLKDKKMSPNKTQLVEVYELHIPVPELSKDNKMIKLTRRYENFDDYLRDLVQILEVNMLELENQKSLRSADVLFVKIQKIKKFLETGKDPEYEISSQYSLDTLIKENPIIKKKRETGINKLREYIFQFYPNNEEIVEVLENDIYSFNNKYYQENIDKIVFIFNYFSDSLDNYINKEMSFIELIGLEIPLIKSPDDLPEYFTNPNKTFKYLYSWMPKTEMYEKYKNELENAKYDILKFKKQNDMLSQLEIQEIYSQYLEIKQWEKSKLKLSTLEITKGKNPMRVMLEFLKRERNKLVSRRIYRVATINERINTRGTFYQIFTMCKLENFTNNDIKTLANDVENIIFSYSNKPDIYYDYVDLVKNTYQELCSLITEPKVIVPVTTEFIIKEGNLSFINIKRLNDIIITLDSKDFDVIIKLVRMMRESELNAYQNCLIEEQNQEPTNFRQKLIEIINKVIDENKQKKKELMYSISINTYIPPVLTNIVPKIQNGPERFYVPNYYIIGENEYIYGGNFPDFINSETGNRNYTDDDIYSLAVLFKINYVDYDEYYKDTGNDKLSYIKKLYNLSMEKMKNYSDNDKQIVPKDIVLNYNPTLVTKKKYTSFVNYIYKTRMGVKYPGEVYIVYKDRIEVSYAVPFKTNEYKIPVYSSKFLNPDIKNFYYIEGPAEFEETSEQNFIYSTMYIFVEYTDKYGKTKLFREGVNYSIVKRTPKENFDACNRFTNEFDCNDINSYGIEKMKCRFIKNKCVSVKEEIKKQDFLFDISKVLFTRKLLKSDSKGKQREVTDYNKTKLWNEALKKANEYISQLIFIKKLNESQIQQVATEQKTKLLGYYNFLQQLDIKKPKLEIIIEDTNYSNLKQLTDFLIPEIIEELVQPVVIEPGQVQEQTILQEIANYTGIMLPHIIVKNKELSIKQLVIGNKYLLPDNTISVLLEKTRNLITFDNGQKFRPVEVTIREHKTSTLIQETYFKITKENLSLLKNPPTSFYYTLYEKEYALEKNNISIKTKKIETKEVPLDILYLVHLESINKDDNLPKDEITTNDIYNTLGKVLYCLYQKDELNFLESLDIFPATQEAKVHSLKYSVDLIQLSKKINGDIELSDVINANNKVLPTVKTISNDIISQLEYGILNKDFKLLERYIKIAYKHKPNESETINLQILKLVDDASKLILEKEKIKEQIKEEKLIKKQEKELQKQKEEPAPSVKISYVVTKRKNKKQEDD